MELMPFTNDIIIAGSLRPCQICERLTMYMHPRINVRICSADCMEEYESNRDDGYSEGDELDSSYDDLDEDDFID